MTTLATSPTITVTQDPAAAATQLIADIAAVTDGTDHDADALVSRPSILRRLAARLAGQLPPATDRILSSTGADAQLATAVALHSGIPVAVIDEDGLPHGDLYPAEQIAIVEIFPDPATTHLREQVTGTGAAVLVQLTAIGQIVSDGTASPETEGVTP